MRRPDLTRIDRAAEQYFKEFVQRHGLEFKIEPNDEQSIWIAIPAQPKLSFEIQIGCSGDIIQLAAGRHWGEWYINGEDVTSTWTKVETVLTGLLNGTCRVVEKRRGGEVCKTSIELLQQDKWRSASTRFHSLFSLFPNPFKADEITYTSNQAADKLKIADQ